MLNIGLIVIYFIFNTTNLLVNTLNFGFTHYFLYFRNTSKMKSCCFSIMQNKYWYVSFDICSAFQTFIWKSEDKRAQTEQGNEV